MSAVPRRAWLGAVDAVDAARGLWLRGWPRAVAAGRVWWQQLDRRGRAFRRGFERVLLAHLPASTARLLGLDAFALDPHSFGALGEALARRYLARFGWRTLARRLWAGDAEFDLLAERAGELAAVEVKSRRVPRGEDPERWPAGERVDAERLGRLVEAARRLARDTGRTVRVHVLEVYLFADGRPPWVRIDPEGPDQIHLAPPKRREAAGPVSGGLPW